ncbi:hypothetical protein FRC08_006821, partial [Ceratobasidium sp. 394]
MKHLPGPHPTSCITCRRRKKRCDRARPTCIRCMEGGFQCLGYDYGASSNPRQSLARDFPPGRVEVMGSGNLRRLREVPQPSTAPMGISTPRIPRCSTPSVSSLPLGPHPAQSSLSPAQPSFSHGFIPRPDGVPSGLSSPSSNTSNSAPSIDGCASTESAVGIRNLVSWLQLARESSDASSNPDYGYYLPPLIIPDPSISGVTIRFIMSQYEPLFELVFFKPAQHHLKLIKSKLIMRMLSSSVAHWSLYLGARIFQTLLQDGEYANVGAYTPWLDRFDQLCITSGDDCTLEGMANRLSGGLELSFLRYITSNISTGYALIR